MFKKFVSEFEDNIEGLREFVELIDPILEEHQKKIAEENATSLEPLAIAVQEHLEKDKKKKKALNNKVKQLFDGDIKVEIDKNEAISFSVKSEDSSIAEALDKIGKTHLQIQQLYKNSLISLLSSVEWFFSQILHLHYDKHPNSAGINKKTMTLDDLKSFKTINDAERFLIDNKIESILRGSFFDWMKVLKDELNLKINYVKEYESDLVEIYQRRNIMVHNGGVVNSIYLSKVDKHFKKSVKQGDKLIINKEYLDNAIDQLHLIFILITSELWKKLEPENEHRGKYIMILGYDYLLKDNWKISRTANQFLYYDKKMPISHRTAAQLNVWLCDKEENGFENLIKEVKGEDYSDKSLLFQVALASLRKENDFCYKNLSKLLKSEDLMPEDLMEFPVLKEIRDDKRFEDFIKTDGIMVQYFNKSN